MASLSQYPAALEDQSDLLLEFRVAANLDVVALFLCLEVRETGRRTKTPAIIPMTLPTTIQDTPMGVAEAMSRELLCGNSKFSSEGLIQQSFLVATLDGYASRSGNDGLPDGFVSNSTSLIHDDDADATLLKQLCSLFSREPKQLSNLKSRPTTASDVNLLLEILKEANLQLERPLESGITSECGVKLVVEAIYMMQNLRDFGSSFEDLFWTIADGSSIGLSRYRSSILGREVERRLAFNPDDAERDRLYYMALGGIIKCVCPVFISPIAGSVEVLAEAIKASGMKAQTLGVPTPLLRMASDGEPVANPGTGKSDKIFIALMSPIHETQQDLKRGVIHLSQKSIRMSKSAGTLAAPMGSTNR